MSDKITADIHGFEPGAVIELFELDLSSGTATDSEPVLRWHSGHNENMQEIIWQGNRYSAMPIEAEGFEFSGKGSIPRPSLTVANITSILSSVINSYDDLVGAKVTRKKTFAKYLDSYCYTNGYPTAGVCTGESGSDPSLSKSDCLDCNKNGSVGTWTVYNQTTCESATGPGIWYASAIADDTAHFPEEIWYVDRKAVETRTHIQFELTAAHDIHGVKLPSRTVVANSCPWVYRGVECGYSGSIIYAAIDAVLTPTVVAGIVTAVTITNGGVYFTAVPTISFSGANGSGAVATASILDGAISSITLTAGGSGYGSCDINTYTTKSTCEAATPTAGVWDDTTLPTIVVAGGGTTTIADQFWDINNNKVTDSTKDVCSKTFTSCELRFPEPTPSPFGGFPGAGINMGSVR